MYEGNKNTGVELAFKIERNTKIKDGLFNCNDRGNKLWMILHQGLNT